MPCGLPLPVGCLTGRPHTLRTGFAKWQFRKCVFWDTLYYEEQNLGDENKPESR